MYISQDPIGLAGNNPTLYGYVCDSNTEIDPFGLECGRKVKPLKEREKVYRVYFMEELQKQVELHGQESVLTNIKITEIRQDFLPGKKVK